MYTDQPSVVRDCDPGLEGIPQNRLNHVIAGRLRISLLGSLTNVKVILLSTLGAKDVSAKLARVYEMYALFLRENSTYMAR